MPFMRAVRHCLHFGNRVIRDSWEWLENMIGVLGGNAEHLTLRQILWRYQGITYQQYLASSQICATLYNVQRTKRSQKVWTWQEFHPWHNRTRPHKATGAQVISTMVGWCGDQMRWAPGYSLTTLFGDGP